MHAIKPLYKGCQEPQTAVRYRDMKVLLDIIRLFFFPGDQL